MLRVSEQQLRKTLRSLGEQAGFEKGKRRRGRREDFQVGAGPATVLTADVAELVADDLGFIPVIQVRSMFEVSMVHGACVNGSEDQHISHRLFCS